MLAGKGNEPVRILYNGKIFTAIRGEEMVAVGILPEVIRGGGSKCRACRSKGEVSPPRLYWEIQRTGRTWERQGGTQRRDFLREIPARRPRQQFLRDSTPI